MNAADTNFIHWAPEVGWNCKICVLKNTLLFTLQWHSPLWQSIFETFWLIQVKNLLMSDEKQSSLPVETLATLQQQQKFSQWNSMLTASNQHTNNDNNAMESKQSTQPIDTMDQTSVKTLHIEKNTRWAILPLILVLFLFLVHCFSQKAPAIPLGLHYISSWINLYARIFVDSMENVQKDKWAREWWNFSW